MLPMGSIQSSNNIFCFFRGGILVPRQRWNKTVQNFLYPTKLISKHNEPIEDIFKKSNIFHNNFPPWKIPPMLLIFLFNSSLNTLIICPKPRPSRLYIFIRMNYPNWLFLASKGIGYRLLTNTECCNASPSLLPKCLFLNIDGNIS